MRSKKGFTLVELLVVICIAGTIIAILLPVINHARKHTNYQPTVPVVQGKPVFVIKTESSSHNYSDLHVYEIYLEGRRYFYTPSSNHGGLTLAPDSKPEAEQ